jgi:hypothetical protein
VLAERHQFTESSEDESPKIEILSDDDFEATVFEEAPQAPAVDTALNHIEDPESLDVLSHSGHTSSENVAAPPLPHDQTMERNPVAPPPKPSLVPVPQIKDEWTKSDLSAPAREDDWVVTNVAAAVRSLEEEAEAEAESAHDDGTPVEGVAAPAVTPPLTSENAFVAGEIDVPTPPPDVRDKTPGVEFTAASSLLGNAESGPDPDTGSRTPPIERRSS